MLIAKFSALNCFEIGVVKEENNLQTQITGFYGAQWSSIAQKHNMLFQKHNRDRPTDLNEEGCAHTAKYLRTSNYNNYQITRNCTKFVTLVSK